MNSLTIDPKTGFLQAKDHANRTFNAEKKIRFLELALQQFQESKLMPNVNAIAEMIGVSPRTIENHLKQDEVFADEWRNIRLMGKWNLESKMYEFAQRPGGYMDRITWLRKEFPEEYNPEQRVIHISDNTSLKSIESAAKQVIDAEIVPNPDNKQQ